MAGKWFYRRAWAAQVEKFQGVRCTACGKELGTTTATTTLCAACYLAVVDETRAEEKEEQPCQQK